MDFLTAFLIALGLAMDAFAVSIANGLSVKKMMFKHAVRIALFFGLFQAIMPVLGFLAALNFRKYIAHIAPWIAFGLLTFIGIKMIYESKYLRYEERKFTCQNMVGLIILSFATSIDALVIGISFAVLEISILIPVIIIGMITFILSLLGNYIGERIGHFFENRIEIIGGIILIFIGLKILVEHFFH